jgi:hypothetical protein
MFTLNYFGYTDAAVHYAIVNYGQKDPRVRRIRSGSTGENDPPVWQVIH